MDYSNYYKFKKFLNDTKQIPSGKVKYYEYWVKQFIYHCQRNFKEKLTSNISLYLESLKSNTKFENWQVEQAQKAVYLFVNNIFNLKNLNFPFKYASAGADIFGWQQTY